MNRDKLLDSLFQAQTLSDLEKLLNKGSLEGILNSWLLTCIDRNYTEKTLKHYKTKVSEFIQFIGNNNLPPEKISPQHITLFKLAKSQTCKPSSIHGYHRALHTFFEFCVENKFLAVSPMVGMRPPKVPKEIIVPYTQEQIQAMLNLCDDRTFLGSRNKSIILLYISTSLRHDEMSKIQLQDVNFVHKTIRVMGKGNKERVVGFGKHAAKALMIYLIQRRSRVKGDISYLWLSEEGNRLTYSGLGQVVYDLKISVGIDIRSSTHALRHTFATEMLRNGADLATIQSLMGHSTLDMSRRYAQTVNSQDAVKQHPKFDPVDRWNLT